MNIRWLLHRNIRYFARYYRLVAMAVVITVAVIVGSLVVGDSVRMTLVRRVTERLGNTETIIFSRSSFISDSILSVSLLGESGNFSNFLVAFFFQIKQNYGFFQLSQSVDHPIELL